MPGIHLECVHFGVPLLLRSPSDSCEENRAHIELFHFLGSDPAAGSPLDSKHGLYSCK